MQKKNKMKRIILTFLILWSISFLGQELDTIAQNESETIEEKAELEKIRKRKLGSYLSREWELDDETKRGTFKLRPYQPNYIIPFRWTDRFNRQPFNENPHAGQPEYKNYQNAEAFFQVSVKAKILQGAFWGKGDVWVGYTQKAYWQVYNGKLSRPFREMNYEPEVMFVMPLRLSIGDLKWRMLSVAINHQSNGKEQVLSRSWNRLIFTTSYEWGNFVFYTKTAFRFKEKNDEDENPSIENHIGRFELMMAYNAGGGHTFAISTRNNLSFRHNRNYLTGQYVFPISGDLKGVFQIAHGYGDSMIDYNHKQTSLGLGVVLLEL